MILLPAARGADGRIAWARTATRQAFTCLGCGAAVSLHRGEILRPHFAHVGEACGGEGALHAAAKALVPHAAECASFEAVPEHAIGRARVDIALFPRTRHPDKTCVGAVEVVCGHAPELAARRVLDGLTFWWEVRPTWEALATIGVNFSLADLGWALRRDRLPDPDVSGPHDITGAAGPWILFGCDTETFPIRPARQAPRVVCGQCRIAGVPSILLRDAFLDVLEERLRDPRVLIFGHEIAYDLCCAIATRPRLLGPVFEAYAADRITCTHEREKLIRIAKGTSDRCTFGLVACVERYHIAHDFHADDKTGGGVRVQYWTLDGVPVAQWPAEPVRYALADLVVEDLYLAQEKYAPPAVLEDQFRQARASFWLRLTSAHGMRVDPRAVAEFARRTEIEHTLVKRALVSGDPAALEEFCAARNAANPYASPLEAVPFGGGLVRPIGSKDTKAAAERMRQICAARDLAPPLSKKGKELLAEEEQRRPRGAYMGDYRAVLAEKYTALDADACAATGDPVLIAYARYTSIGTLRARAERLRMAGESGLPIQPYFTVLKKTGRTSCSGGKTKPGDEIRAFGDQTQNLPRTPGLRECYTARPGCLIFSVDWKAAELGTLAQTCVDLGLGSRLAQVLNSGKDVHLWYACLVNGWAYEWAEAAQRGDYGPVEKKRVKAARQGAKPCNFGFPGGLGTEKFRLFAAKQYQVYFTDAEAKERKGLWLEAFPEMVGYFQHINALVSSGGPLVHFRSNRYRGDLRYTSAANSYFQGRCGDMLKDAGFRFARACLIDGLPARTWNEAHDEILGEAPAPVAYLAAGRLVEIMEQVAREWCPAAPPAAEPALQRSWRKGAEPYYDARGRLAPWEDRPLAAETISEIKKKVAAGETPLYVSWVYGITESRTEQICSQD